MSTPKIFADVAKNQDSIQLTGVTNMQCGLVINRTVVNANYIVDDEDLLLAVTNLDAERVITIPERLQTKGRTFRIKDEVGNSSTNNIVIAPENGLIEGASTYRIKKNFDAAHIYCNGFNWFLI